MEKLKDDNIALQRHLDQALAISIDKDEVIRSQGDQIAGLQQTIADMQEKMEEGIKKGWQLDELKRMLFGKRSERFIAEEQETKNAIQQTFGADFDATEIEDIIKEASKSKPSTEEHLQALKEKTSRKRKRHIGRKGKQRRPFATHIETKTVVIDTPGDKTGFKSMGVKRTIYYDYVPGKIVKVIEEHPQYISEDGEKIISAAPVKPRMVESGIVGNNLLAHMHTERFVYYVPYYRQLQRFQRTLGLSFAPSTVNHWEKVCYKKLLRLLKVFKRELLKADYIKADETSLKYVNDIGKGKASNGWLWIFYSPELKIILFEFHPTRGHEVPLEVLKGFKGTLQTDGLSSYETAFEDNEDVDLMGCLVHIRRGFEKSLKQNKALADEFLTLINIIYRIEAYATRKGLDKSGRLALRQRFSKRVLDKIKARLLEIQAQNLPPDSPIVKAVNYGLNQWHKLRHFLENGKIDPDNNSTERAIRPITLFRKNSLFAGNQHGGQRAALFYSLVETCKLNNIDPFEYFQDIYERLHDCPANELIHLLPSHWKPAMVNGDSACANV
jgi:transposase